MGAYGKIAIVDVSPENARSFTTDIARCLGQVPHPMHLEKFGDGEGNAVIGRSVRGHDVYIVQSYQPPIGERKYELELAVSAARSGGGARRITAVLPYCFGMRGERQTKPRQSVPIEVFAKTLSAMGVNNLITTGLHEESIPTIFRVCDVNVTHLPFEPVAAAYALHISAKERYTDLVVASPDIGGMKRARRLREIIAQESTLRTRLIAGDKYRTRADVAEIAELTGNVEGLPVLVYDDIGSTLGTIKESVDLLKAKGAKEVHVALIHPVLAKGYESRLEELCKNPFVKEIVFGNTIPLKAGALNYAKVRIIPVQPFFAAAIKRLNEDVSTSELHQFAPIMEAYSLFSQVSEPRYVRLGEPVVLTASPQTEGGNGTKASAPQSSGVRNS